MICMKLYLMLKNELLSYKLVDTTDQSLLIPIKYDEKVEFQITVNSLNKIPTLYTNDTVEVIDHDNVVDYVEIEEYKTYFLKIKQINKIIIAFSLPIIDKNVYDISTENINNITFGSSESNMICYKNSFVQDNHAVFAKEDDGWYIQTINQQSRVFLNNNAITKCKIRLGDIIIINGFKLIWMDKFIRINNPNKMVSVKNMVLYDNELLDNSNYTHDEDNFVTDLYKEDDYFYHTLRVNNKLLSTEIEINAPPAGNETEEIPYYLTLGTTITMCASSFMSVYMVVYGLASGTRSILTVIPQIVLCIAMIIGTLVMPKLLQKYQKKMALKKEQKRQSKYTSYLNRKQKEILDIIKKQEQTMNDNNPSVIECNNIIFNSDKITNVYFWSRSNKDDDFLTIRLGTGNLPALIDIKAPTEQFTLNEDNLLNDVHNVVNSSKFLHNVPITLSLAEHNKLGIISNCSYENNYIDGLILQLVTMQSPIDLKIVILTSKENEKRWDYIKYLPHSWSDDKMNRFFASTPDEIERVSAFLEQEYKQRKENDNKTVMKNSDDRENLADIEKQAKENSYKNIIPYYLIIDDNYKTSKNFSIIDILMKTVSNYGFSYFGIGDKLKDIPTSCSMFVDLNEKNGAISENNIDINEVKHFSNEYLPDLDMRKVAQKLFNIPIMTKDTISQLPQSLTFLEMFDVSRIEQLNVITRWKNNNPVNSLSTVVGVHKNGDPFKLDLHEKYHGPHGLIAGMTGSGKSEFIITYILSLIVNYHPYEVQFVLIDYKGGGLAGAFENKETGIRIPHLVGTITNLDTSEMNRTLVSIESEMKRRQRIFNEVRDQLEESTIDIYKYQKLYREGIVKEPMAHLFIISDEFAELKQQQPDFMQQLISTARIGRSLGIHLILATQKPSGVVNDQIWSNSKFKVCLKVQDRSDSMEMLKKPDAASIKETGRFYLQVGYDDYFDIGQSGWSGAKYIPSDNIIKKVDDSIDFIDNTGTHYKSIKDISKIDTTAQYGEQLTNIVKYICELGKKENIVTNNLWLDALPDTIFINDLKNKYNYEKKPYNINPIIGEYDDPSNQSQGLLTLDLTNGGNTAIWGQVGSGKENLITTIILSTILNHNPDEINYYILDFGSESLKIFNNIPHVGNVITMEEANKVSDLFAFIDKEVDYRKNLFADYAGNYIDYCNNSGNKLPLIAVIINGYENFCESFYKLSEEVQNLFRDATKYGIRFIITSVSVNGIKGRTLQYFNNKLCLQLPNNTDYRNLLSSPKDLIPAKAFGRGIVQSGDFFYEFQTAILVNKKDLTNFVREVATKLSQAYNNHAKKIPTIPNLVTFDLFNKDIYSFDNIPIGYSYKTKEPVYLDLSNKQFFPILTNAMSNDTMNLVYYLIRYFSNIDNNTVEIIDFVEGYEKDLKIDNLKVVNSDLNNAIINMYNELVMSKDISSTKTYIFLGIGKFQKMIDQRTFDLLGKLFTTPEIVKNNKFIFVDTYFSFKNIEVCEWYQKVSNKIDGLWLGEGVGNQISITIPNIKMEEKNLNLPFLCYVVNDGKYDIVKHIVDDKEEYNEK